MTTVPNPLDELQSTLRALEDRRDRSAIRARALRADLTGIIEELRDLDLSIAATRGLLALADAAKRNAASSDDAAKRNAAASSERQTLRQSADILAQREEEYRHHDRGPDHDHRPARTTSKKPAKK